jgi:hypothetical protein
MAPELGRKSANFDTSSRTKRPRSLRIRAHRGQTTRGRSPASGQGNLTFSLLFSYLVLVLEAPAYVSTVTRPP